MAMFYALAILCLSGSALAQVSSHGACPRVKSISNFDVSRFMGRWYEAERYFHNFEFHTRCNIIDYSRIDNSSIYVINSFVNNLNGKTDNIQLPIYPNQKRPSEMVLRLPLSAVDSNYWILGIDYDSYVVIYGCTEYGDINLTYSWILTRNRNPDQSVLDKINKVLKNNRIGKSNYYKVEQKGCKEHNCY